MSVDDLVTSLKQVASERLTSPFWGSFLISWLIVNYKFVMVLLSDNSVSTTIYLIHTHSFTSWTDYVFNGFVTPLAASLFYVFVYPKPALKIYEHTLDAQIKLKNVKLLKTNAELVSVEDVKKIRTSFSLERADLLEQLNSAQSDRDALAERYANIVKELNSVKLSPLPVSNDSIASAAANDVREAKKIIPDDQRLIIRSLFNLDGRATRESIRETAPFPAVQIDSILDDLESEQIVTYSPGARGGGVFSLTPKGRKLATTLMNRL